MLDVISSVCVLHVSRVLPPAPFAVCLHYHYFFFYFWTHPIFSLCSCQCRNDICRGTLFRPLQFFCKVRYVNWPVLPFQCSCMCCMCPNHVVHSILNPNLMKSCCFLSTSQNLTWSLGQDTFLNYFFLSAITQVTHNIELRINSYFFPFLFKTFGHVGTFIVDLFLMFHGEIGLHIGQWSETFK